jgi:CMP-N-acetylneuraminic acid synthetase
LKLVFDEIWVSTDDQRIAKIAESYEVKVHFRNEKSATDSASSLIAVQEFLGCNKGISLKHILNAISSEIFLSNNQIS